jgi:hypothetical protein
MPDTDLHARLNEANEQPRYFALIMKGQTIVKMIVQKKPIKEGDIQYAKRENGGNGSISGVCIRTGSQIVMQVVEPEPALHPTKVRDFIIEETGNTLKPQWQVVAALPNIPDT